LPGPAPKAEKCFEAMKAAIASGMSDRQAYMTVPGAPSSAAWTRYLQNHPERAAEIAAVRHAKGKPSLDRIASNFEAMLSLIAEGRSAVEAGRELGINGDRLTEYIRANPGKRPAYAAAMKKRAKLLGIRSVPVTRRKSFTADEFDKALELIKSLPGAGWPEALRRAGLPANGSLQHRARRDPAFRARLTRVLAEHAAVIFHQRYQRDGDAPNLLLASLMRDQLFAKLYARFKRYVDSRFDMVGEAYAAILSGEMTFDDLKSKKPANLITKRAIGNGLALTSLDAPARDDDDGRDLMIDTIANPSPIIHW